jgi:hypothetical protein
LLEPVVDGLPLVTAESSVTVALVLALILATFGSMVFGELVPKNYAIAKPYRSAALFGIPMQWVNRALRPLILFLNGAANWTVRRLGIEPREELAGVRSMRLRLMIRSPGGGGSEVRWNAHGPSASRKTVAGSWCPGPGCRTRERHDRRPAPGVSDATPVSRSTAPDRTTSSASSRQGQPGGACRRAGGDPGGEDHPAGAAVPETLSSWSCWPTCGEAGMAVVIDGTGCGYRHRRRPARDRGGDEHDLEPAAVPSAAAAEGL